MKIVVEAEVVGWCADVARRTELSQAIDSVLGQSNQRVRKGRYRVTIESLPLPPPVLPVEVVKAPARRMVPTRCLGCPRRAELALALEQIRGCLKPSSESFKQITELLGDAKENT